MEYDDPFHRSQRFNSPDSRTMAQNNRKLPELRHHPVLNLLFPLPRIISLSEPKLEPLHKQRDDHAHLDEREVPPRAVGGPVRERDERRAVVHELKTNHPPRTPTPALHTRSLRRVGADQRRRGARENVRARGSWPDAMSHPSGQNECRKTKLCASRWRTYGTETHVPGGSTLGVNIGAAPS